MLVRRVSWTGADHDDALVPGFPAGAWHVLHWSGCQAHPADHLALARCRPWTHELGRGGRGGTGPARDFAHAFAACARPSLSDRTTQALLLVVSELVSNVFRHTAGTGTLRLTCDGTGVVVEVVDASSDPPRPRSPDLSGGSGGFGWHLVTGLSDGVTVTVHGAGKSIRVHIPFDP